MLTHHYNNRTTEVYLVSCLLRMKVHYHPHVEYNTVGTVAVDDTRWVEEEVVPDN